MTTQKPEILNSDVRQAGTPRICKLVNRGAWAEANRMSAAGVEPHLGETVVSIDDCDFTLGEFVKMFGTLGGWGMRVEFVVDEKCHVRPEIERLEPDKGE